MSMVDDLNYKDDLRIDLTRLHEEWLLQPQLFMKYSAAAAEAEREYNRAHEKVKVIRSELASWARSNPDKLPGKKSTDAAVEAYYREHKDHQQAKEEMIEAEYAMNMLRNAVFAFSQRKVALENLVKLNGQEYYSGPTVPFDVNSEEFRDRMETAERRLTTDILKEKRAQTQTQVSRRTR